MLDVELDPSKRQSDHRPAWLRRALVFLIGLLLGMQDALRMWVLGATFILGPGACVSCSWPMI